MQRDALLLAEIVAAGDRAASIVASHSREEVGSTGDARDALLWNMAVIGEADLPPFIARIRAIAASL